MTRREACNAFVRKFGVELVSRGAFVATFVAVVNALRHAPFSWTQWVAFAVGTALAQAFLDTWKARATSSR